MKTLPTNKCASFSCYHSSGLVPVLKMETSVYEEAESHKL